MFTRGHWQELPWRFRAIVKERRLVDIIVTGVRVLAVVATIACLPREHLSFRVGGFEVSPGDKLRREEGQSAAGQLAGDGLAGGLLPPAFGLPVVLTRLLNRSRLVVPKSNTLPSSLRSKAITVLRRGQKVTVTGTPPTVSLTISCQMRICRG